MRELAILQNCHVDYPLNFDKNVHEIEQPTTNPKPTLVERCENCCDGLVARLSLADRYTEQFHWPTQNNQMSCAFLYLLKKVHPSYS